MLVFQVPNEEDNASTVQVEVAFPADKPIAEASVQPVPGWTAEVTTAPVSQTDQDRRGSVSEAVSKIVWTGGSISPVSSSSSTCRSACPTQGPLVFKALQTYSDGTIVRWIEVPGRRRSRAGPPGAHAAAHRGADGARASVTVPKDVATHSDVDSAKTVGIIGIVVGAIGCRRVVALFTRRRAGVTTAVTWRLSSRGWGAADRLGDLRRRRPRTCRTARAGATRRRA